MLTPIKLMVTIDKRLCVCKVSSGVSTSITVGGTSEKTRTPKRLRGTKIKPGFFFDVPVNIMLTGKSPGKLPGESHPQSLIEFIDLPVTPLPGS